VIILSVTGRSMREALAEIRSSRRDADLIELRLDLIAHGGRLQELIRAARRPVIATCRPVWEGGAFRGSERERARLLEAASRSGARYLDIELKAWRALMPEIERSAPPRGTIASVHHFGERPASARQVYTRLQAVKADVIKYAFDAPDISCIGEVTDFLERARRDRRRAIAIAMGPEGEITRVLYRKLGSWATYGRAESGEPAAPGQLTVAELRRLYRSHRHTSRTKVFGVVGNPVEQSKGVQIHNRLLRSMDAVYCRMLVTRLQPFMRQVTPMVAGFSVTIPYKEAIVPYLRAIDEHARAIAAVNTVLRRRSGLWGTNCDGIGALEAIERVLPVSGRILLILGSGGTARAIASEARRRGAKVIIAGRRASKARRLARELGAESVRMEVAGNVEFDILANATPVGMAPDVRATPISSRYLKNKVVFDAVYNPPETRLLVEARRVGARTISGVTMFINQAAIQFRLFTGIDPDRALMQRTLRRALAPPASLRKP
jgi:3-dehydroquinate dehydratase/shikimate dehydrogenase